MPYFKYAEAPYFTGRLKCIVTNHYGSVGQIIRDGSVITKPHIGQSVRILAERVTGAISAMPSVEGQGMLPVDCLSNLSLSQRGAAFHWEVSYE